MSDKKKSGMGDLGKGVTEMGKAAAGVAMTGVSLAGSAGRTGGSMLNGAAGFAGRMLSGVAGFATKHPKVTFLVGLYAGLKGVQHVVHKQKEKKAAAEAMGQAGAPQAQSYDPQSFTPPVVQTNAPAPQMPQQAPQQASGIPAEQAEALRQMLQAQNGPEAPAPAAPQPQGRWAQQIEQERQQQGQGSQIGM